MFKALLLTSLILILADDGNANPYPRKELVPQDSTSRPGATAPLPSLRQDELLESGVEVLRAQLDWDESSDSFHLGQLKVERSGTGALLRRSRTNDKLGSYKAVLRDLESGELLAHDSIGTGQEYRRLTRALTFRFPFPARKAKLVVTAENPATGQLEQALEAVIDPNDVRDRTPVRRDVEIKLLRASSAEKKLFLNVYAEGYAADQKARFFQDAQRVVETLEQHKFPHVEQLEFRAVFAPSNAALGAARDPGLPVAERDSFLGLYYPYWRKFGRWYHVVYPTREARFRDGLAQAPYDYPVVLVDSTDYWGVGNYKELTAIPSSASSFSYLLMHEFGHFFGLNEEYEGGGPTELAFAPGIAEPWSQNITFLREPSHRALKWRQFVEESTPLPTPESQWQSGGSTYGAYQGGYGDTEPYHQSHKPGFSCVMERYREFCPICTQALEEIVAHDLGQTAPSSM